MNWKQHMIIAVVFSALILLLIFNIRDPLILAILILFSAFSAILPDMDHKMSKGTDIINKAAVVLSLLFVGGNICSNNISCLFELDKLKIIFFNSLMFVGVYFVFSVFLRPKHRGVTHSIVFTAIYGLLIYFVLGFNFAIAGLVGYGSHLLADKEIKIF